MDVREKLVELIGQVQDCGCDVTDVVEMNYVENITLADYPIANGVTVQEWISVKDRLPDVGASCLCFTGSAMQIAMYEGNDSWWTQYHSHTVTGKNWFTHWMPLPEPPKEETQTDCTYNKNGHCIGQKLMPECDAKNCDRRK